MYSEWKMNSKIPNEMKIFEMFVFTEPLFSWLEAFVVPSHSTFHSFFLRNFFVIQQNMLGPEALEINPMKVSTRTRIKMNVWMHWFCAIVRIQFKTNISRITSFIPHKQPWTVNNVLLSLLLGLFVNALPKVFRIRSFTGENKLIQPGFICETWSDMNI